MYTIEEWEEESNGDLKVVICIGNELRYIMIDEPPLIEVMDRYEQDQSTMERMEDRDIKAYIEHEINMANGIDNIPYTLIPE